MLAVSQLPGSLTCDQHVFLERFEKKIMGQLETHTTRECAFGAPLGFAARSKNLSTAFFENKSPINNDGHILKGHPKSNRHSPKIARSALHSRLWGLLQAVLQK